MREGTDMKTFMMSVNYSDISHFYIKEKEKYLKIKHFLIKDAL